MSSEPHDAPKYRLLSGKAKLFSLSMIVVGVIALAFSIFINSPDEQPVHFGIPFFKLILEHIGVICIVVFSLHIWQELVLYKEYAEISTRTINEVFEKSLPNAFKNFRQSGVVDVFTSLNFDKLHEDISKVEGTEIFILCIWMPYLVRIQDELLKSIVNRNCVVKILIHHPEQEDTLKKRASCLTDYPAHIIRQRIEHNIFVLNNLRNSLPDDKKDNFQAYFNKEWVSVSLHGYGSEIFMGHYLQNKLATEAHVIKIAGNDKTFYKEIRHHFNDVWKKAVDSGANIFDYTISI